MKTSESLTVGATYTRAELREQFGIEDQTINTGIFQPSGHDSVWLFITRDKTADMTPYHDSLDGEILYWQGQTEGLKDPLIIDHEAQGLELLVFFRETKTQFEGYAFRYEGRFTYERHSGSRPTQFTLRRLDPAVLEHDGAEERSVSAAAPESDLDAARQPFSNTDRDRCLVETIADLRQSGRDSVVSDGNLTALQEKMHVPDRIEDWVADRVAQWRAGGRSAPLLVVLSGNAGDGKSDLIERLRLRPEVRGPDLDVIADATHADSPSQSQADRLVHALDAFASPPAQLPEDPPCVLVAINVGMVIAFFSAVQEMGQGARFDDLRRVLHSRLGLSKEAPDAPETWDCEVVNLDHRNLLGVAGEGLFSGMLRKLDPEVPDSITYGAAAACAHCPVRRSCWVRTNLNLLRLGPVRDALHEILWEVSLGHDIHLSPRNVWDFLYQAITGGLELPGGGHLSCEWLRETLPEHPRHLTADQLRLVHRRLLYHSVFDGPPLDGPSRGAIMDALALADPIRRSGRHAHVVEGEVRAAPPSDASRLSHLALMADEPGESGRQPDPLLNGLAALTDEWELWHGDADTNAQDLAFGVSRRARLTGLPAEVQDEVSDHAAGEFRVLLRAYGAWNDPDDAPAEVELFWRDGLVGGVAAMFGVPLDGRTYFRLDTLSPTTRYPAFVPVNLKDKLRVEPDPVLDGRAAGLEALAYVPRTVLASIRAGGEEPWLVPVDLQLFRLLQHVTRGYAASSVDLGAFFRLRYACERLGATDPSGEIIFRAVTDGQIFRLRQEQKLTGSVTTFARVTA